MMTIQLTSFCILKYFPFSEATQVLNKLVIIYKDKMTRKNLPNKVNIIYYEKSLLTHEKIGFWCWLTIVLLNILGLVSDHADEGVKLNDGHAQVDDVHRIPEETLQCGHKFCMREVYIMTNT